MPTRPLIASCLGLATSACVSERTLSIEPSDPITTDDLRASLDSERDDDKLVWWRDGERTDIVGPRVASEHTQKGQTWKVTWEGPGTTLEATTRIGNAPPTLVIDPSPPPWRVDRPPSATIETFDADGDPLETSSYWRGPATSVVRIEGTQLPSRRIRRGESWTLYARTSDGRATTEATHTFVVDNTPPQLLGVSLVTEPPTKSAPLRILPSSFDADNDPITHTASFAVNGALVPNTRAHLLTADAFSRGDRVTITVQPHDGLDSGEPFVFDVDIANAPPEAAGAQITPDLPDKYDVLTCLVIDPQDSDGDEISQHITWWRGTEMVGHGPTLDAGILTRDDAVWCEARLTDPTGDTTLIASDPVLVQNSLPQLTAVEIVPDPPTRGQALTTRFTQLADPDHDALYLEVTWFVNGAWRAGTRALSPDLFERGDEVTVEVRAHDGYGYSNQVISAPHEVVNAPPEVSSATLTPRRSAPLGVAEIDVLTEDPDGDAVDVLYTWHVNGQLQVEDGASFLLGSLDAGDLVTVSLTPFDGLTQGPTRELGPLEIVADDAEAVWLDLTPQPALHRDDLICTAGSDPAAGWSDPVMTWEVNGVPADPSLTTTTTLPGDTVPWQVTDASQIWQCTATWDHGVTRTLSTEISQGPPGGNLLLLLADDLGVDKVGAYGRHPDAPPTPRIDALADQGIRFDNAYAYTSCSPTRAALLTGRYGRRTGIGRTVVASRNTYVLSTLEVGLPELLAHSPTYTYTSSAVGKWHLGSRLLPEGLLHPNDMGFDWYGGPFGNLGSGTVPSPPSSYTNWEKVINGEPEHAYAYITSDNVDEALRRIDTMPEPWMLWVTFTAPHSPFHVPPERLQSTGIDDTANDRRKYDAMVEAMDTEIGRLFDSMDPDMLADTTVVFMGDNGTPTAATTPPFRPARAKGTLYEGGTHVPLIIAGPHVQTPGTTSDALVHAVDLLPTFADIAGVPFQTLYGSDQGPGELVDWPLDGRSWLPIMEGSATVVHDHLFTEKFAPNGTLPTQPQHALRDARYKLLRIPGDADRFFDLWENPAHDGTDLMGGPLTAAQQVAYDSLSLALEQKIAVLAEDPRP